MKLRLVSPAAAIVLPLALAGCFTSEQPLLTVENAEFPFEKIVVADQGGSLTTLQRKPEGYGVVGEEEAEGLVLLLDDLGDNTYLVQLSGETEEGPEILYGVVQANLEDKTAKLFLSVADESEIPPDNDFKYCEPGVVCLADTAAYVAKARALIAAGAEPDNDFTIVSTE